MTTDTEDLAELTAGAVIWKVGAFVCDVVLKIAIVWLFARLCFHAGIDEGKLRCSHGDCLTSDAAHVQTVTKSDQQFQLRVR